jgi:hypothetical protein
MVKMAVTLTKRLEQSIINHEIVDSNPAALTEQEKMLEKCSLPQMVKMAATIAKRL